MTTTSSSGFVRAAHGCSRPHRSSASARRQHGAAVDEPDETGEQLPLFDVSAYTVSPARPTGCEAGVRAAQAAPSLAGPVKDTRSGPSSTSRRTTPTDASEISVLLAAAGGEGDALAELLASVERLITARRARVTLASLGAGAVQTALRHRHLVLVPRKGPSDG